MKLKRSVLVLLGCLGAAGTLLHAVESQAVGTRRVGLRSAEDFRGGELKGVAIDGTGQVRAGFNLGEVPIADATSAWSALPLGGGKLLIATGHEGRLFEFAGGAAKEVARADTLILTSLVQAFGSILVGSLPGATLYEYKNGKLTEWLKIADADHIFALAYDEKAQALYAATGPDGKLFRITRDKKAQVYFDAEEQHLMSVALGNGKVYTGASDKAKLYELSGPGRASVLYDFGLTEVRAIAVSTTGDVFAIANEIKGRTFPTSTTDSKSDASKSSSQKGKGTLYRFDKNGRPEQLLEDTGDHFVSLALDAKGKPFVGTGQEGRLYTVDEQRNSILMADVEERQISALVLAASEQYVIGSDPVVVRPVRGVGGADAVWTSKVIDLGIRARFGRMEWTSSGQLEFATRTGSTQEPDDTWSAWSTPLLSPGKLTSPQGRYLQVRATFARDKDAVLSEVVIPFVTDNLRAVITKVEAETPSQKGITRPDGKLEASGGPISDNPQQEVRLKWDVDNPDKDPLRYGLQYQLVGTNAWFDLLKPQEKLMKTSYTWDTKDLPEGHYRVRVTATDAPANPPETATQHELVSNVIVIDNTPPEIRDLAVAGGRRVRGVAIDGVGPIARVEFSLAGSDDWVVVVPKDGVFDETREDFEFDVASLSPSGPALVSVRAYDAENNAVVKSILLR